MQLGQIRSQKINIIQKHFPRNLLSAKSQILNKTFSSGIEIIVFFDINLHQNDRIVLTLLVFSVSLLHHVTVSYVHKVHEF